MEVILDHLAIAVADMKKAIKTFEDLGLKFSPEMEKVHSQGVLTAFAQLDTHAHLELLEPLDESGPVSKFIEKKGEGIHHICFQVKDVRAATKDLKDKGLHLIYDTPVVGARNCLVNFIHPKSANGVLIEILEKPTGEV